MSAAPIPPDDDERVAALRSYGILDTEPEQGFDDITFLAAHICSTPFSTITLVDRDRQFFKSEHGFGTRQSNRDDGICACTILNRAPMVINDLEADERFELNPFVTGGPKLRFYAGAPLVTPDGFVLGTVCVFDTVPRHLEEGQLKALESLSRQVMARMELHRKMLEEQRSAETLRTAEKLAAVGRMASAVAHEINNPLQSVTNLLFMIGRADDAELRAQFLTMAQDELARVSHIVTQALRFHQQSTLPHPARLGELVESILLLYRTRLNHARADVRLRDSQKVPLLCFADDIRQVLAHLISNSLDGLATKAGGVLHVRIYEGSRNGQRGVRLTIADTGCGIPQEVVARLFQPFVTSKGIRGTGLGLWVSRGILNKRGADIHLRSRAGSGTVVRLFFPLQPTVDDAPAHRVFAAIA